MPDGADAAAATGSSPVPLASALAGGPTAFVRADVALDGEPVIGSFTVDGMTFAVVDGGSVELVGIAPGSQPGDPSEALAVSESVAFEGVDYAVSSIGAYAFYLSGATSVALPASVGNVDERAFRSSDVASIEVDPANPSFASFDGALYSADLTRLLLIPGGRQGAVRIPSQALDAPASAFSHCALVTAIDADAGGAAYLSWEGLLYDAAGTTLLRVPAGATDITIRDGCTTIAAGALEGCASLATITAPASVTSVSPDAFTSVPIVSLPAVSVLADGPGACTGATEGPSEQASSAPVSGSTSTQLTAMVALSSTADDLPEVDPAAITVTLPEGTDADCWDELGVSVNWLITPALTGSAVAYANSSSSLMPNGGTLYSTFTASYHSGQLTHSTPAAYWAVSGMTVQCVNASWGLIDTITLQSRTGCTFLGWSAGSVNPAAAVGSATFAFSNVAALYANWRVQLTWSPNGGYWGSNASDTAAKTSNNDNVTTATSYNNATVPTRPGYTFKGWSTSSTATTGATSVTVPNSPTTYYAVWAANTYTVEYWNKAGTTKLSSDTGFVYGTNRALAAKPTSEVSTGYTAVGWATSANQSTATYGFSSSQKNLATSGTKKLYLAETANPYTIAFDSQGGSAVPAIGATYDASVTLPSSTTRQGYALKGWDTKADGTGTRYQAGVALTKPNLTATANGTVTLYAQWEPVLSADVPIEVTARVDLLGIEEQQEATGYIESRCGEPLTVAAVAFEPLSGATELFGAASVADVALEVLAAGSTSPDARFALDASATQAPASASAFRMAAYGTKVPISYRFAIPDELLPSLVETEKPVCAVAYTVALA